MSRTTKVHLFLLWAGAATAAMPRRHHEPGEEADKMADLMHTCGKEPSKPDCFLQRTKDSHMPIDLLAGLQGVRHLGIFDNYHLLRVPSEIGHLAELTALSIQSNPVLQHVPTELGMLSKLTELRITDSNDLERVPTELGLLTGLSFLQLYGLYELQEIPSEIGMLTALTRLDFVSCDAAPSLPTELGQLGELHILNVLDDTAPVVVTEHLKRLRKLQEVDIFGICAQGSPFTFTWADDAHEHEIQACQVCPESSVPGMGSSAPPNSKLKPNSCSRRGGVAHGAKCTYECAPGHVRSDPTAADENKAPETVFTLRCDGSKSDNVKHWPGRGHGCVAFSTEAACKAA